MKKKPTRAEAGLWKCNECSGHYADGKVDCMNPVCPLYEWMPYRKKDGTSEPDFEWHKYNPRAKGLVLKEDSKRTMTDEQKAAAAERLAKARKARKEADT
jgi:hypothetical protein